MKPNGYILFEDSERVVIATGFAGESNNRKTGDMIQIWILVKAEDPVAAVKSGKDRLICGNCRHRGARGKERSCYVNIGQAPLAIWRAWKRGSYPVASQDQFDALFSGRTVRFGAYGDPTWIPLHIAERICAVASGWTGYTHQWRKPSNQGWRRILMASVDSVAELVIARGMGWGTFRVTVDTKHQDFESMCKSESAGITCAACMLCNGRQRNIFIPVHGTGAVHFSTRN